MSSPEVLDLEELAGLEALSRDWLELAARIEGSSYFQTPDWVLAWWDTIAERPRTRLAAWRSPSGRLEAMVALSRGRERLHRRLPFAVPVHANAGSGVGDADHCAWLVPAERGAEVAAWLTDATAALPASRPRRRPGLARSSRCPPEPGSWTPPPARGWRCRSRPDPAGPSSDFVRQLRRFTRRLGREGVSFEWIPPAQVDDRLLAALFELHARGRQDGPGSFDAGQARPSSPPGRERRGGTRARGGGRAARGPDRRRALRILVAPDVRRLPVGVGPDATPGTASATC